MRKLRTLEIWNGRPRVAGLFRYKPASESPKYHATITWKATWVCEKDLGDKVIRAWKTAAARQSGLDADVLRFTVERQLLDGRAILSHAHAIRQLSLHIQVLDPGSEEQITLETSSAAADGG